MPGIPSRKGIIMLSVASLTCEHLVDPVGVSRSPRFSWQLEAAGRGVMQRSRHIQLALDEGFSRLVWDSGEIFCDASILVSYDGPPLAYRTRCWWRVKISDDKGRVSAWSKPATFVTALEEWAAPFVSAEGSDAGASSAGTLVRGEVSLGSGIKAAFISATALGVYHLHLNGSRVCDWAMTPGWTEYGSRLLYQMHDVTALVREGRNSIGAMLGVGWYKGNLAGWLKRRNIYGSQTAFSMELTVQYDDGTVETHMTGDDWRSSDSPVKYSEIYNGEKYDAQCEIAGWDMPGIDTAMWHPVRRVDFDPSCIVPQDGLPVRPREKLKPVEIFTAPNGERVVDFGQVLTGWVRLKVRGEAGDVVRYSHAEVLDRDGNFYTANLRSAKQQISYTLKGGDSETYEPFFTFQGFRYIRVDEFPGEFDENTFLAVVAHSDMPETGSFSCSNPRLNQLVQNVRWSMKGNFFDIPTDCPQRDERIGWTGDAQIFIRAAGNLHNTAAFFRKWLRDMAAAQYPNGGIPNVVPDILTGYMPEDDVASTNTATAGWGDAGVICPWNLFKYFGDKKLLAEHYPMMKGWVEFVRSRTPSGLLWNTDRHLGDWVALDAKEGGYLGATPVDLIASAYYARSTELLAKAATVLGKNADARTYLQLWENIREAFVKEFFTSNGRLCCRTQTGHVLALCFKLVPPAYKKRTLDTLVEILAEYDNHLSTGFLGTPYICHALSENGRLDLAYELLQKEDYPSWLYPLTKGATTIWEHWDGMKPDGSMWSDNMNSFNHYAYGAVVDWMFCVIGGIDTEEDGPAWRRSLIAPRPGGGIVSASVSETTPYGLLSSSWKLEGNAMTLDIVVPHGTTSTVSLPMGEVIHADGVAFTFAGRGQAAVVGSGAYHFVVNKAVL